jgi:hypothetical protein
MAVYGRLGYIRGNSHYAYPQLTLAGGVGKRVLGLAMDAAGYDVS